MASVYKRAFEVLSREQAVARDRRRWRRVGVALSGRMLDSSGRELACRTEDVSAGGARIAVLGRAARGSAILHMDGLGRLESEVVWSSPDTLAVRFEATAAKRERIIEELTWRLNEAALGLSAERRGPRITLENALTRAALDSGEVLFVRVADVSLVGAALETAAPPPPLGSWVRVGMSWGRVARHFAGGFAIDFEPKPKQAAPD